MIDPRERLVLLTVGEAIRLNGAAHTLMASDEPVSRIVLRDFTATSNVPFVMPDLRTVGHQNQMLQYSLLLGPDKLEIMPIDLKYDNGALSFSFKQHGGAVMDAVQRMFGRTSVMFTETNLRECQPGVGQSAWARRWIRLLRGRLGKHGRRFTKQERRAAWRQKMRAHRGSHD